MGIQVGDWVRAENGEVGRVVLINRVTVFVDFGNGDADTIKAFLESQLTKADPPTQTSGEPAGQ